MPMISTIFSIGLYELTKRFPLVFETIVEWTSFQNFLTWQKAVGPNPIVQVDNNDVVRRGLDQAAPTVP